MSQAQIVTELGQAYAAGNLSYRNKIINGNFDVWQRITSQTLSLAQGGFWADRWNLQTGGTGIAVTQTKNAYGPGNSAAPARSYYSCNITNAGDPTNGVAVLTQRIEGVDSLRGTIAISALLAADAGKAIAVNVTQSFGTGGSPSASVQLSPQKVTPGSLFSKQIFFFNLPSTLGKSLGTNNDDFIEIEFYFTAGSAYSGSTGGLPQQTGNFSVSQVQVEQGPIVTPFEQRPLALEYLLCQRFYSMYVGGLFVGAGAGISTSLAYCMLPMPCTMRKVPSLSFSSLQLYGNPVCPATGLGVLYGAQNAPILAVGVQNTNNLIVVGSGYVLFTSSGWLDMTAEL